MSNRTCARRIKWRVYKSALKDEEEEVENDE